MMVAAGLFQSAAVENRLAVVEYHSAVAFDAALLRSLAFALAVDGYSVETYQDWQAARRNVSEALCVIVDIDICRKDEEARRSLRDAGKNMILLADGMFPLIDHTDARVLTKPLIGLDILATVSKIRNGSK
jgi:hypothetical protein